MPNCHELRPEQNVRYIREKLLGWYKREGRNYPWRRTRDPYKILIAEIMLRRTRADQVVPIYRRFVKQYPIVESLSKGRIEDVKEITHSLGLHWRNEKFLDLAKYIMRARMLCKRCELHTHARNL